MTRCSFARRLVLVMSAASFLLLPCGVAPARGDDPPAAPPEAAEALRQAEALDKRIDALMESRRPAEAVEPARRALALREQALGPEHAAVAQSLYVLGLTLQSSGQGSAARPLYQRSLALREKLLGPESPELALCLNNLGALAREAGDLAAARSLYERALALREKAWGPEHIKLAESLGNLSVVAQAQLKFDEAKALLERALHIREKALGADHPEVADSLSSLGQLLARQGRFAQAQGLAERALAIHERALGAEHRTVATSLLQLARMHLFQGHYALARPLYERALAIDERVLGPEDPEVATLLGDLVRLHQMEGAYTEALPLAERALAIYEKALGPEHMYVAAGLNGLASLHSALGHFEAAQPLLERAIGICEKVLGPEHPDVGTLLGNLGEALQEQAQYPAAEALHERALRIKEHALGPEHPDVAVSLGNLSQLLRLEGRYEAALVHGERALRILEKVLGPDHPQVSVALTNVAVLRATLGQHDAARPLYERALAIGEHAWGPNHPELASTLDCLAQLFYAQGQFDAARPLFERALAIREKALGPAHPDVAVSLNNLASLFMGMERREEALPFFERALAAREKVPGREHPDLAQSLSNLGLCLWTVGQPARARPMLERALAMRERLQGSEHPEVASTLDCLANFLMGQGDLNAAQALFERSIAIEEHTLGAQHPELAKALTQLADLHTRAKRYDAARALYQRALGSTAAYVQRLLAGLTGAERLALLRSVRWQLDTFLRAAPELGTTGYPEVLHLKGIVARAEAAERALERSGSSGAPEQLDRLRAAERLVARLANSMPPMREALPLVRWRSAYARALQEREQLALALAKDSAPLRAGLERMELGLADIQAELGQGEVLIDLLLAHETYLAFVVQRTGEVVRIDLGEREPIEQAAAAFVKACQSQALDSDDFRTTGALLRTLVMEPLASHLPAGTQTLYLVPDGALAAVPFAALPGAAPGHFVLDDYALVHLAMAQDLVPWKAAPALGTGALLVGGVDFQHADALDTVASPAETPPVMVASAPRPNAAPVPLMRGGGFTPLLGTVAEVAAVAKRIGADSQVLSGSQATEARLLAAAPGRRMLHLATHGFVHEDLMKGLQTGTEAERLALLGGGERQLAAGHDPMVLCGLALAGANPRDGGGGDDGILTASEASHANLGGCDLVVLSACETAKGTPASGEGVLGLVLGFRLAGARHVVGSLWPVDDEATSRLMVRLYDNLLRTEHPLAPAQALREAALWLRTQQDTSGTPFSAPRSWAAFVAYGR